MSRGSAYSKLLKIYCFLYTIGFFNQSLTVYEILINIKLENKKDYSSTIIFFESFMTYLRMWFYRVYRNGWFHT